jgi:hypothetical protein
LKPPRGKPYRDSESTRATVDDLIGKATAATNTPPHRVSVFPNVQSFAVEGSPALVREVLKHDDIASAMANVQKEDLRIRPIEKRKPRKTPATKRRR